MAEAQKAELAPIIRRGSLLRSLPHPVANHPGNGGRPRAQQLLLILGLLHPPQHPFDGGAAGGLTTLTPAAGAPAARWDPTHHGATTGNATATRGGRTRAARARATHTTARFSKV